MRYQDRDAVAGVLAKDAARRDGAREAWFVDSSGAITEGASSNAWIVTAKGVLVTRPLGQEILPGVTRATVMDVAKAEGLRVEERAFTRDEALRARKPSSHLQQISSCRS